jgi:hypothetical protein
MERLLVTERSVHYNMFHSKGTRIMETLPSYSLDCDVSAGKILDKAKTGILLAEIFTILFFVQVLFLLHSILETSKIRLSSTLLLMCY